MLKHLVNECSFTLAICTKGPVLVKSGHSTVSGPDMTPVLTYRNGNTEVYLPGSSLKGVFRSHIEKVTRTLKDGIVCNPFVKTKAQRQGNQLVCHNYTEVSCSDKFEIRQKNELRIGSNRWQRHRKKEDISSEDAYRDSCPVCRLFGSTSFIGRVAISDAYLKKGSQQKTEQRDGVGIDRFTGGAASRAKFDLEVVSSGVTFETEIHMRNFEVWQLGMLMLAVQDLEDGMIRIGSGRSRGLGNIKGKVSEVSVKYLGVAHGNHVNEVWGLGKFLGNNSYGTDVNDQVAIQSPPTEMTRGIRKIITFSGLSLDSLKQNTIKAFVKKTESWQMSEAMKFEYLQFRQIGGNE